MIKKRYLLDAILDDLKNGKMAFIGGPRQVGKTTLATFIGETNYKRFLYLNWDRREDRQQILESRFGADNRLLIFDEIHKYRNKWKNYIKGIYDTEKEHFNIIVTGSARLDLYRRGGDSMMGRYYYWRLHPFSVGELTRNENEKLREEFKPFQELAFPAQSAESEKHLASLIRFGGFPQPFLEQNDATLRRWQNQRMDRVIKEDIRDIEVLRDLSALQVLVEILPTKVGSRLSLNALREDFEVAHKTMALWVEVLERFYYLYRIYPFAGTKIKSLRKEPKLYLWDWSEVRDGGARLENLVASHLLKFVHFLQDAEGYRAELHYLRDVTGREVDFLVAIDRKPWFAVEVKESDTTPSKHLSYFGDRLKIPFLYQVVRTPGLDMINAKNNVRVMSVDRFLSGLV